MRTGRNSLAAALVGLLLLLPACGGESGGLFDGLGVPAFWGIDTRVDAETADPYYRLSAGLRGTGVHCYVYVEAGQAVSQEVVDRIVREFDNTIYPRVTGAFGAEWNPGVDGDPRITLLLLDIRDDYFPPVRNGFVGGIFSSANEFLQRDLDLFPNPAGYIDRSNEREMLWLDINPQQPGSAQFFRTLAHELQHMIHWNQKTNAFGTFDDTWLDEAMSEAAPLFCSYGADTGRIGTFAGKPTDSLTLWNGALEDYAVAYLWAQYHFDQYADNGVFFRALQRPAVGIASVDEAFAAFGSAKTFASSFKDWSIANMVAGDNAVLMPIVTQLGRPELRYAGLRIPALLTSPLVRNPLILDSLQRWSNGYYVYENPAAGPGTVTWNPAGGNESATLFSRTDNTMVDVVPGAVTPYGGTGYLVVHNATEIDNAATVGGSVVFTSVNVPEVGTAAFRALAFAPRGTEAPSSAEGVLCGHDPFSSRERALRPRGLRPRR